MILNLNYKLKSITTVENNVNDRITNDKNRGKTPEYTL